jgi:glyoxylase-like metal-dependent hydrolase (beta-lactamase superfamily II)
LRFALRQPWLRNLLLGALLTLLAALPVFAVEVRFERVADGVYAHVGDLGGRTLRNEGLNANIGLVLTNDGAVLIDPGATWSSARDIHQAVERVSPQPVRWVINTGGQDHRWLGNGYFKAQGAEILAHEAARSDMSDRGGDQLAALRTVLGSKAEGTEPVLATRWLAGRETALVLGGVRFEFRHRGGGHTPGDLLVWLPQQQVLFAGDLVYVDRLLGVLPVSSTAAWLASFEEIAALAPRRIVPGHGRVTDLATASAQTERYLRALRAHMKRAVDDAIDVSAAVKSFDLAPWRDLANSAELHPGNANRTYLELERE